MLSIAGVEAEGDEDGTDEPDNKDSTGVEATNGNGEDYDFSPSNDPYEDSNND